MKTLNWRGFSSFFSSSFLSEGAAANFGGDTATAAKLATSMASSSAGINKNMMFMTGRTLASSTSTSWFFLTRGMWLLYSARLRA
jgi:hypothetical protein